MKKLLRPITRHLTKHFAPYYFIEIEAMLDDGKSLGRFDRIFVRSFSTKSAIQAGWNHCKRKQNETQLSYQVSNLYKV